MLVDTERVLLELKRLIGERPSHGARDLLAAISRLEVAHAIPHDEFEAHTRRFVSRYYDALMDVLPADDGPLDGAAESASAMAGTPHLRRSQRSEELCQTQQQHAVVP